MHYFSRKGAISLNTDLFSIIDAGSISNMPSMVQILLDEDRPMFILIDNDDSKIKNRLIKKVKEIDNPAKLSLTTISDIKAEAISIEDLLPINIYMEAVASFIASLAKEGIIVPYDTPPPSIHLEEGVSKRYNVIANSIVAMYKDSDNQDLDPKTPISKVGIAHELEKIIALDRMGTMEEEARCLKLIKLIATKLNL
jgi:hypothetical protein